VIDTYEPEINRYGGPGAIAAAERLFCADSVAVIGQLQRRARRLHELPVEVLAAMNVIDLLGSLGVWDWMGWTLRTIPRSPLGGMDRRQLRLVDPAGSWDRLVDLPGGRELVSCWEGRAEAAAEFGRVLSAVTEDDFHDAVASVLHMHANRLIGLGRAREDRAMAIVRDRVHSLRAVAQQRRGGQVT
jgi:thiopeptide-type bacteriocin biosynthesis protein